MSKSSDGRGQIFVLVEGKFEYEIVLKSLCKCFPELEDLEKNVKVFTTNIYNLYKDIVKEYSEDWYDQDINIPLLIGRKEGIALDRTKYTDVLLVFDYERQDPSFDTETITKLQKHFCNSSEDGMLYINYPMVESLYDMKRIPDDEYWEKRYYSVVASGDNYKRTVKNTSWLWSRLDCIEKIRKILKNKVKGIKAEDRDKLLDEILTINTEEDVEKQIADLVRKYTVNEQGIMAVSKAASAQFVRLDFKNNDGVPYWIFLREKMLIIVEQNIRKIWRIQNGNCESEDLCLKDVYDEIDFLKLLMVQNEESNKANEEEQFMWVVNSFITILGGYKFFWERVS